jgi:uncharacterized protein YjbI with pentapeptide repeats
VSGGERESANAWRFDLSGAVLKWANLAGVHLGEAYLMGVHLERADLRDAHLDAAADRTLLGEQRAQ